jgi:hypothetical protein
VAALGSARGFVGENANAFKFILRHIVSDGLQRAGVIDRGQPVATITAAVEKSFILHRLDRAVAFHAGFRPHFDRMSAAVDIKGFLASERNFDRPSRDHRKLGRAELVGKRIALAAEATSHWRRNDANAARGEPEHFSESPVDIVRGLRRRP